MFFLNFRFKSDSRSVAVTAIFIIKRYKGQLYRFAVVEDSQNAQEMHKKMINIVENGENVVFITILGKTS